MGSGGGGAVGRAVWGAGLSSRDLQVAGSNPVAAQSCHPPSHRGFGDWCFDLRGIVHILLNEYTGGMGEN